MTDQRAAARPIRRWRPEWRAVLGLVAAYAVIRWLHLWLLAEGLDAESAAEGGFDGRRSLYDALGAWDGGWYVRIADGGYPDELSLLSVRDDTSAPLAFPPLFPMAMRALSGLGMTSLTAGILISALAGIVAVVGVYAVARDFVSPRAAWLAAALWAAGPMTIVLSMAYSEALFVALAAWALWLARRGWWLTAGALGLLAGLTRSNGLAVGAALVVAAALAIYADRRPGAAEPSSDESSLGVAESSGAHERSGARRHWRPVAGALLGVLGVPLWWLYVAIVGGRIDGWFTLQEFYWGSRFDFGASVAQGAWRTLTFDGRYDGMVRLVYALAYVGLFVALVLLVALVRLALREGWASRWWPLAAYAATLVVLAVGSAGYTASKVRFLVPMFALLLLPAAALARASRLWRCVAVATLALATGWLGAFMLSVWPYAI